LLDYLDLFITYSISRFRENPVAVCMDIVKMFLQVRVKAEDQPCLRYFYRPPGSSGPPETYQMMVQIFGGGSSMTACIFALRQTAVDNPGFEDVADKLKDCFYIDNYADSYTTTDEAIAGCSKLVELLSLGGFELSQISSCSREVLTQISVSPSSSGTLDLAFDDLPTERTLGLQWDCESDSFKFLLSEIALPKTKRELSSYVGRFFDPLGFIVCVLMPLRIVLQDVWRAEREAKSTGAQNWDRTLCANHILRLKEITEGFPSLTSLRIRRCIFPVQTDDSVLTLHIFCDASLTARGSVAYLQATSAQTTTVTIIQARGKVTPLDPETIPHQELLSCKIGAELYKKIASTLRLKVDKVFFWTDSQAVLYWLKKENGNQPHYVKALRDFILVTTNPSQWRYVPSSLNPADYITKGIKAVDFNSTHRFILGPEFLLHASELHWPSQPFFLDSPSLEVRNVSVLPESNAIDNLITAASTLSELKLSIANAVAGNNDLPKSPVELHSALLLAVKQEQARSFPDEFKLLSGGKSFQRSSRLRKLIPLLGEDGVIRVGGRLDNADALTETTKHPIILPSEGKLTELVVMDTHLRLLHSSTARTHYEVRATFWILRGEQVVGRIIHRCKQCRRQYAPLLQPRMAPLPKSRVTAYRPVFYNTGVDLLGPFNVPVKRSMEKRWVTLFTCLDTRALHLEVTTDLSAPSFLNAFTCFSSLRGRPHFIYSDNGTNLVAGDRKLREGLVRVMEDPGIIQEFADQGVTWRFNPAAAPHWGGAWERLVRSVKTALKGALGERSVKEDVLRTTLAEVSSLINGRPLTHLGVDPDDQRPITPNHFLIGRENRNTPYDVFDQAKGDLDRDRWVAAQQLTELCWRRWLDEYLPGMTERAKWTKEQRNLEKGDIVLILDNKAPRGQWVTGVVSNVIPGEDKVVRYVTVTAGKKSYRRPVTGLCLLKTARETSDLNPQQVSSLTPTPPSP